MQTIEPNVGVEIPRGYIVVLPNCSEIAALYPSSAIYAGQVETATIEQVNSPENPWRIIGQRSWIVRGFVLALTPNGALWHCEGCKRPDRYIVKGIDTNEPLLPSYLCHYGTVVGHFQFHSDVFTIVHFDSLEDYRANLQEALRSRLASRPDYSWHNEGSAAMLADYLWLSRVYDNSVAERILRSAWRKVEDKNKYKDPKEWFHQMKGYDLHVLLEKILHRNRGQFAFEPIITPLGTSEAADFILEMTIPHQQ